MRHSLGEAAVGLGGDLRAWERSSAGQRMMCEPRARLVVSSRHIDEQASARCVGVGAQASICKRWLAAQVGGASTHLKGQMRHVGQLDLEGQADGVLARTWWLKQEKLVLPPTPSDVAVRWP